jgi:hypothetical protein
MKLLARVGGKEGSGTKAVDKIGAPVSPLSVAFFRFLARDFLLEFLGAKKNCGELSCWTPYYRLGVARPFLMLKALFFTLPLK